MPTVALADYAAWIDADELAIMTGHCWSELPRPLRAVPVLEDALTRYTDTHARDKALMVARVELRRRRGIERAAETITASLRNDGKRCVGPAAEEARRGPGPLWKHRGDIPAAPGLLRGEALTHSTYAARRHHSDLGVLPIVALDEVRPQLVVADDGSPERDSSPGARGPALLDLAQQPGPGPRTPASRRPGRPGRSRRGCADA